MCDRGSGPRGRDIQRVALDETDELREAQAHCRVLVGFAVICNVKDHLRNSHRLFVWHAVDARKRADDVLNLHLHEPTARRG